MSGSGRMTLSREPMEQRPAGRAARPVARTRDNFSARSDDRTIALGHRRRTSVTGTVAAGLLLALAFFGGFGAWAALAPLKGAVVAGGTVKVQGDRKEVEHLEGGILRLASVADGDKVEAGQVLFVLDDTRLVAARVQLDARLTGAMARQRRLNAEKSNAARFDLDIPSDPELVGVILAQLDQFQARRARHEGALVLIDERVALVRQEINAHEAQNRADRRQLEYLLEEIRDADTLLRQGLQRKPRWLALKRQQEGLDGQINQRNAQIARARQEISRLEQQKQQLFRERDDEIARENRETTDAIIDLRQRVAVINEQLARIAVRAPVAGTVIATGTKTPGAVISPGERLVEIVPLDARLVVEARIAPKDIESVHMGARARIRLTAYNARRTPPVTAHVSVIAADRQEDARTGQPYYRAELSIDAAEIAAYRLAIVPGMAADVMIETKELMLLVYLVGPLTARMEKAFRER